MAHICVGVDLGSHSVKVAEMEASSKGFKLLQFKEYPLSQSPNHDRRIELIDLLLRFSDHYSSDVHFIFGVQQRLASLRWRSFPFRERHKILKSVTFDLEDEIPFTMEDAIFDVKVVRYKGNQTEFIAVACPKGHILNLIELCQDGSLQPHIISVEGLATANLFSRWMGNLRGDGRVPVEGDERENEFDEVSSVSQHSAHVILQMGHSSSLLMIFKGETLFDVRNIDFGGRNVAEAIANTYKISPTEAIEELQSKSYVLLSEEDATREQIVFSDVIKKSFDDLSIQVRLTLLERQTKFNLKYHEIFITGGLSQIKNIGLHLTQNLGIPTNRLKNFSMVPEIIADADPSLLVSGTTAIGLAMEGFKKPKNPAINFLKGEFANKNDAFQRSWERWSYTVRMAAIVLVLFFVFTVVRYQVATDISRQAQTHMKKQAKAIAGIKGRRASEGKIKKLVKKKKKLQKSIDSVKGLQNLSSTMDVLKKISEVTPRTVSSLNVKAIKITNTEVIIEGEMGDAAHLTAFVNGLQKMAQNKKVQKLKPSIQPTGGRTVFSYQFEVNRQTGGVM